MNVVITINGRKAIPLRALPYVGNWSHGTSPDALVHALSEPHEHLVAGAKVRNRFALHAFRYEWPRFFPIQSTEWGGEDCGGPVHVALSSLTKKLKADERIEGENFDSWRRSAVLLLPSGDFVWLDEFEAWFSRTRPLVVDGPWMGDDEEVDPQEIEYHQASDDLFFAPHVPAELSSAVRSGFERIFDAPATFESLTEALDGWFDRPLAALPQWQRHRVRTDFCGSWDELSEGQRRSIAASRDAPRDPNTAAECESAFYRFDKPAALAGIPALEAAQLLLVRDGELLERLGIPCIDDEAPPLARKLLTLAEMRETGVEETIHPLAEWLRKARAKGIEYLAGLDWAVANVERQAPARQFGHSRSDELIRVSEIPDLLQHLDVTERWQIVSRIMGGLGSATLPLRTERGWLEDLDRKREHADLAAKLAIDINKYVGTEDRLNSLLEARDIYTNDPIPAPAEWAIIGMQLVNLRDQKARSEIERKIRASQEMNKHLQESYVRISELHAWLKQQCIAEHAGERMSKGGRPRKDRERQVANSILDAMLVAAGMPTSKKSPWPAGVVLDVAQRTEMAHCEALAIFNIEATTLRDWLTGRFEHGARRRFDRMKLPAVTGKFSRNSFTATAPNQA